MQNQTKKKYFSNLCDASAFYVPHKDANHLNAQDIIKSLLSKSSNILIATLNCFENDKTLVISDEVLFSVIWDIQTKVEMIEKILPLAFEYQEGKYE
ncbi:hypothetical protein [Acinetobacter sp. P8-3-8]|uniref:hypothetical protein n=1 Tax=Acinetobacter sp. P8-3-8 TaxID=1029823 RepID=UPI00024865AC|nr:hypothetical protein [Acinetobacter sp. P8-3-8]